MEGEGGGFLEVRGRGGGRVGGVCSEGSGREVRDCDAEF